MRDNLGQDRAARDDQNEEDYQPLRSFEGLRDSFLTSAGMAQKMNNFYENRKGLLITFLLVGAALLAVAGNQPTLFPVFVGGNLAITFLAYYAATLAKYEYNRRYGDSINMNPREESAVLKNLAMFSTQVFYCAYDQNSKAEFLLKLTPVETDSIIRRIRQEKPIGNLYDLNSIIDDFEARSCYTFSAGRRGELEMAGESLVAKDKFNSIALPLLQFAKRSAIGFFLLSPYGSGAGIAAASIGMVALGTTAYNVYASNTRKGYGTKYESIDGLAEKEKGDLAKGIWKIDRRIDIGSLTPIERDIIITRYQAMDGLGVPDRDQARNPYSKASIYNIPLNQLLDNLEGRLLEAPSLQRIDFLGDDLALLLDAEDRKERVAEYKAATGVSIEVIEQDFKARPSDFESHDSQEPERYDSKALSSSVPISPLAKTQAEVQVASPSTSTAVSGSKALTPKSGKGKSLE